MLIGVIGLGMSLWFNYNARNIALNVVQGRRPFAHPPPPIVDEYGDVDEEAQR